MHHHRTALYNDSYLVLIYHRRSVNINNDYYDSVDTKKR